MLATWHREKILRLHQDNGVLQGSITGVILCIIIILKSQDVETADPTDIAKAKEVCRKCYLSCTLLCGANNSRYLQLKVDLSNNTTKGTDNFPKTIVKTLHLLTNYAPSTKAAVRMQTRWQGTGLHTKSKDGALLGPKRDSTNKEVECWHCGGRHYKNKCPKLKLLDAGIQNINVNSCNKEHILFSADDGYGLVQKQAKGARGILSPHHMYINTCASYASTP